MKRQSKKTLFETLARLAKTNTAFACFANVNDTTQRLNHRCVGNETYGNQSQIYIDFPSEQDKQAAIMPLVREGFDVRNNWTRTNTRSIDVPVTYFKGWHWNE